MLEGPVGLVAVTVVGLLLTIAAGYFTPSGLKAMASLSYWSVVIGAIMPAVLFLAWSFARRKQSEDFALLFGFVVLVLLADLFIGLIAGFYLKDPSAWWLRMLVGFGFGALTMAWTLWAK